MDTLSLLLTALDFRLRSLRHEPGRGDTSLYASQPDAAVMLICPDTAATAHEGSRRTALPQGSVALLLPGAAPSLAVPPGAQHLVGQIACDTGIAAALFSRLPPLLVLPFVSEVTVSWRQSVVAFLACESGCVRHGGSIFSQRLMELLFIQAVRRPVIEAPKESAGWHGLLTDPGLQRALALLGAAPGHPWRLDELARQSGLSRTVLVERFVSLVGQPPMTYLRHLRLHQARRVLEGTPTPVAKIADAAGYGSEAAFSRSFKQLYGIPPGAVRNRQAQGLPAAGPDS